MTLREDLKAYIAKHGQPAITIAEPHSVAIVGEYHAPLWNDVAMIRADASVRLVLELLRNARYRFFSYESFFNAGPIRLGVRDYWRSAKLPPPIDPRRADRDKLNDREI